MSEYLVRQLRSTPNISIDVRTEVIGASGDASLEAITVSTPGGHEIKPMKGLFMLIGGEPRTDWLDEVVSQDDRGYVLTGSALSGSHDGETRDFETSLSGVFAVGDVRAGSVKRVAAAVGEGSAAVSHVHDHLAAAAPTRPGRGM